MSDAFSFTPQERIGLIEDRALAVDPEGREVLVGLTHYETVIFMEYRRAWVRERLAGIHRSEEQRERHRVYSEKHELARLAVIGEEVARQTRDRRNPPELPTE